MWALFNTNRPPIFIHLTRRECVKSGIEWIGEEDFKNAMSTGYITIEKVTVRRSQSEGKNAR
jgi:hypothetical protein